ncbi:hypothetical protein HYH03_018851 [Edaphochlamys debaryana]|uniref:Uncharacterized protein n=1 Tax=Edaphochlamys debaryana TaxID=47281 RepID=A0A835XEH3_9CHLO|nr:hypothetical protein HYH03_018851 [Edaphochlamys debaryana]|eukprot:KAG2482206.1 hypothetical protein HYH03_018851 [Edaphochlamys debaryana]
MSSGGSNAPATVLQGPLTYEKPKGMDAILVKILCPPTDFADVQRITKVFIRAFVLLSTYIIPLSVVLVPGWLWLVRHELLLGHRGDAILVTIAGLLLFLAADTTKSATASASAAATEGAFTAADRTAYQQTPGGVVPHPAGPFGSSTTAPTATSRGVPASAAAAPRAAPPAAAATAATANLEPIILRVKQRIIKLELLLFGNELTEADIPRDALHARVQALCSEVGVPFGGPGGSSAHPGVAELDIQLQAVEKALGVQ